MISTMGFLLDHLFGSGKNKGEGGSKKSLRSVLFASCRDVHEALLKIETLTDRERDLVEEVICREINAGIGHQGLTRQGFKERVVPELYKLVEKRKRESDDGISKFNYERLKKLAN